MSVTHSVDQSSNDLVASGEVVPFARMGEALSRGTCQVTDATSTRALVATVVAVGPAERLVEAAAALRSLGDAGTVRGILISEGEIDAPPARVAGNTVTLHGLRPQFVNNAVAALRLSSLPTMVWWRGGRPDNLDGLVDLADRIVIDEESPEPAWARALSQFEGTSWSDLRWARLTEWRALMAHFFDVPQVLGAAGGFSHLTLTASDALSARMFAAWLQSSIGFRADFAIDIVPGSVPTPVEAVRLTDGPNPAAHDLVIRMSADRTCLLTEVTVPGHRSVARLVPFWEPTLETLVTNELRIRARDAAFERTLTALLGAHGSR
jgi:glucose-6-phosphate dehydrogenase assembly protein OpcA